MVRIVKRSAHALFVLALAFFVVAPALPGKVVGPLKGPMSQRLLEISIKQRWQMYAPNPQRAHAYMNLTAHYPDGSERILEETRQEKRGWGTQFAWSKTRVDIWRHYANFSPKKRNRNRTWYLKGVCVREARRGEVPQRITMYLVRRRLTSPKNVRKGARPLGPKTRQMVTVQYCKTQQVRKMIAADRERRGEPPADG